MSDKKCSSLAAGVFGFLLGAIALKLVERFCPMYGCCCGGETCCCGDGEGDCCCDESDASSQGCCCADAADSPTDGEAGSPAE